MRCLLFFFFKQKTAYEMRISDWSSDVCSSDLFGDPGFMGTYALNVLDERNWVVVGDRREYRSPPAEAEHLARLDEYHSGRRRSSEIESKIQLAIPELTHATTAVARETVEFANGAPPGDNHSDALRAR